MIELPIQDLGMTDTEYAQLVSKGYQPVLEQQLIAPGEDPDKARKFTKFVGLLQDKPPQTESEGKEFMSAWEDACGYKPNFD
jgi:hypothetical protein